MKILFLSHKFHPDIGGIEIISEVLALFFVNNGHEVHLLTWSNDTTGKEFPFLVIRNPRKLTLLKEQKWADAVFENNPCTRLSWPSLFIKRPLVVSLQTWLTRTNGHISWLDRLKQKSLKRAQKVVACSNAIRENCWTDATVIHNPYQKDIFKILPEVSKKRDFVFLGRLVSDKGVDIALKAFAEVVSSDTSGKRSFNKLSFTIIGDGPEKEPLEQLVSDLNLSNNVLFTGALRGDSLVTCLNEHRFLLVPSIWKEPFGVVTLEGMACGCVPIVSNGGGLPDAVGSAGLVFQRGSVDALVEVIKNVLQNANLETKLRDAAPKHLSKFQHDVISKQYLEILEQAVKDF